MEPSWMSYCKPGPAATQPCSTVSCWLSIKCTLHVIPAGRILVISDGAENSSRYTERELIDRLRESRCHGSYSIGVGLPLSPPRVSDVPQESEPRGDLLLTMIAEETGGRYFEADSPKELVAIMRNIDFRYAYVFGVRSHCLRDGWKIPSNQTKTGRHRTKDWCQGHLRVPGTTRRHADCLYLFAPTS